MKINKYFKYVIFSVLSLVVMAITSCDSTGLMSGTTQIRFRNQSDSVSGYPLIGLRIGNVVHDGLILVGNSSPYYSITPGTYTSVGIKVPDGSWTNADINSKIPIVSNNTYAVIFTGRLVNFQPVDAEVIIEQE